MGGIGDFGRDVLFLDVALSPPARGALDGLFAALRALSWITWDARDGAGLHPHVTVAEQCGARFVEARAFVEAHARPIDDHLDNATLFRDDGGPRFVAVRRVSLRGA